VGKLSEVTNVLGNGVQDYVVSGVVLQYKLVRGRYEREHNRLEVLSTGRYITNAWLQHLMDSSPAK
jgi:hypothetical protein